jgi:hypothetical protein
MMKSNLEPCLSQGKFIIKYLKNYRSRLEDIKYVLEKLKNLEIYPNYTHFEEDLKSLQNDNINMMDLIIKNKKSHLFSLLPLLSEFITTKENDIKLIIKDIFKIISFEIGVKF